MRQLAGRVAAITGAASGIGRALAITLAREGMQVAISDVNEIGLAETLRLAAAARAGARVTAARVDVADRSGVHAWAKRADREQAVQQSRAHQGATSPRRAAATVRA